MVAYYYRYMYKLNQVFIGSEGMEVDVEQPMTSISTSRRGSMKSPAQRYRYFNSLRKEEEEGEDDNTIQDTSIRSYSNIYSQKFGKYPEVHLLHITA